MSLYLGEQKITALNVNVEPDHSVLYVEQYLKEGQKRTARNNIGAASELKTLGFVSLEMFGAVGDGSKDDTPAFQKAVDYALNNNVSIFVSNKRYVLENSINLPKESRLSIWGHQCEHTWKNSEESLGIYCKKSFLSTDENKAELVFNLSGVVIHQDIKENQIPLFDKISLNFSSICNCIIYANELFGDYTVCTKIYNNTLNLAIGFFNQANEKSNMSDSSITDNYIHCLKPFAGGIALNSKFISDTVFSGNFFDYWLYVVGVTEDAKGVSFIGNTFDRCFRVDKGGRLSSIDQVMYIGNNIVNCTPEAKGDIPTYNAFAGSGILNPTPLSPPHPDMVANGKWRPFGFACNDLTFISSIYAVENYIRDSDVFFKFINNNNLNAQHDIYERANRTRRVDAVFNVLVGGIPSNSYETIYSEYANNGKVIELPVSPEPDKYNVSFYGQVLYLNHKYFVSLEPNKWFDANGTEYTKTNIKE